MNSNEHRAAKKVKIEWLFWVLIVFAFLVRFYNIDAPLLDHHSIRQIDTASIARNFYENGYNIFKPQFDGGGRPGYVECEFQLYSYVVAIFYGLFGVKEWIGRLISILCSLLTAVSLYHLIKRVKNSLVALFSTFIFICSPLSIVVGRSFQPESMMLLFTVLAIFFILQWLVAEEFVYYVLSIVFLTLTLLIKIPNLFLGLPIIFLITHIRGYKALFQPRIILLGVIPLLLTFVWYYYAHSLYIEYGNTFIGGGNKFTTLALLADYRYWIQIFLNRLGGIVLTPFGYILLLNGLLLLKYRDVEKLFIFWLIAVFIYIIIVGQGNLFHDYYQYPILPCVSFFCGSFLYWISRSDEGRAVINRILDKFDFLFVISFLCAVLFVLIVFANCCEISIKEAGSIAQVFRTYIPIIWLSGLGVFVYLLISLCVLRKISNSVVCPGEAVCLVVMIGMLLSSMFFLHLNKAYELDKSKLILARNLQELTQDTDLIITTTDSSLGHLYYSHRKGWSYFRKGPIHLREIEYLKNKGASYLLVNKAYEINQDSDLSQFLANCKKVLLPYNYDLYKLEN